ncbi:ABC transporter ATP-binding protein [Ancylobacter amanitiformis]|uniref:ABC-type sugar transport system ATPase subunit n=1 Tax=Ancylobacter amanitiformis TaxID=217069 RepID=A0ABU0LUU2_9HYPH|nr:ABC transporter ATP-binding protein [Ancylobacter amanitiformis]MDQ0512461.1 ABC-type sugar transport system ATPase subunit [Ancylobacter amanitiformis]
MSRVELSGITKRFGAFEAIRGIDLTVEDGEFAVFVGPSGCGKSTLLRLICGLEVPTEGAIRFDDRDVRGVPPAGRRLAMVFQSYALYPHMSVAENMGFALRMAGISRAERAVRVARAAETLQITRLLERRPKELSGGQRQRVAIGRAIVREPSLFLFDEPLSNLDAELRVEMRAELMELHRRLATTMIYVTHDQIEAMTMADRIVVLRDGRIEQAGSPTMLYERPANRFVASFIGSPRMNFLAARVTRVEPGRVTIDLPGLLPGVAGEPLALAVAERHGLRIDDSVELGVRSEHLGLEPRPHRLQARISFSEYVGGAWHLHAGDHPAGRLVLRHAGAPIHAGETLELGLDMAGCHLFAPSGLRVSV